VGTKTKKRQSNNRVISLEQHSPVQNKNAALICLSLMSIKIFYLKWSPIVDVQYPD